MRLSICVASYNGAKHLPAQLESILSQVREGDEVLIADDESLDDTVLVCERFGARVRVVARTRAGGVVPNFERVMMAAIGDGVVLCDQDDVWLPGRLDLIRRHLSASDLVVLNGEVVDEDLVSRSVSIFDFVGVRGGFFRNLWRNSFVGCCMAFRRSLRDVVVPFPANVPWHDWYIGLVASWIGRVAYIDDWTMLYRRHAGNASTTGERSRNSPFRMACMRIAVLRATLVAVRRRR